MIKQQNLEKMKNSIIFSSNSLVFTFYFSILAFLSFYNNPITTFTGDPEIFFRDLIKGDAYKFFKLAIQSIQEGRFFFPITHTPGLEFIDIILLWIHPKFPIIIFLTFLNFTLWAILFMQLYCFGKEVIKPSLSFFIPLLLLIPGFSYDYFLRGYGIVFGTSFVSVLLNISIVSILFSIQKKRLSLCIWSGICLALAGYTWSMGDMLICYSSIAFFLLMTLYFSLKVLTKNVNFLRRLYPKNFVNLGNLAVAFVTFWCLTIPYRLYIKSISMVPTNEVWQRIWQLPLYWNDPIYANNWIFKGGGFPFCRAYPHTCHALHQQTHLHNDINYLKQLTYETFISNTLPLIKWKTPFFIQFWLENLFLENKIIFSLFPIILLLFFLKPNKLNSIVAFFCVCVFFLTFGILLLAHIEVRYFYVLKFTLCVGAILSLYTFIPSLVRKKDTDTNLK